MPSPRFLVGLYLMLKAYLADANILCIIQLPVYKGQFPIMEVVIDGGGQLAGGGILVVYCLLGIGKAGRIVKARTVKRGSKR